MSDELKGRKLTPKGEKDPQGASFIPEELKPILADPDISNEKKQEIVNAFIGVTIREASAFSGPIPPPELLKGYNEAIENGAGRIMAMAERQSNHRMQLENHAIREELKQSRLG